jgi:Tetracyclin repressor-like, C-terminal domain
LRDTITLRRILEERAAAGSIQLRLDPADLAYVIIRVAESFIWREFITGEEPDLDRTADVIRVLLSCPGPRCRLRRDRFEQNVGASG